jgi:hypothetical protein
MRNMKYCSPFGSFVLIGPLRLVCTISNVFVVEYSLDMNSVLVCFPCRKCLHIILDSFEISGISLTISFLLILTKFSKFTCRIILHQRQFAFSFPKQHLSFPISFNMYMLLELLHTHLGFHFSKFFPCLLVIISHYLVSYNLGENIPPREYSLSIDTSV